MVIAKLDRKEVSWSKRSLENIQAEAHRWNHGKCRREEERRKSEQEQYPKSKWLRISFYWQKFINLYIPEAWWNPSRVNARKNTSRHIMEKVLKTKGKKNHKQPDKKDNFQRSNNNMDIRFLNIKSETQKKNKPG